MATVRSAKRPMRRPLAYFLKWPNPSTWLKLGRRLAVRVEGDSEGGGEREGKVDMGEKAKFTVRIRVKARVRARARAVVRVSS